MENRVKFKLANKLTTMMISEKIMQTVFLYELLIKLHKQTITLRNLSYACALLQETFTDADPMQIIIKT